MRGKSKGFTLAELLIVVAIIAVLVAISIPIFTSQLEKSREATDLANVRSAYAELIAAATANDTNVDFNQDGIADFDESSGWSISVPLTQKKDEWSMTTPLTVGGVSSGSDGGSNTEGTWIGQPQAEGTCTLSCDPDGTVKIVWDGAAGTSDPYSGAKSLTNAWFVSARKMSGGSFVGTYSSYDTNQYSEEQYNEFVEALKSQLGITGDDFYFDFSTASKRLRYTTKNYNYDVSQGSYNLPAGESYTIVTFDNDGNVSKIYTNTVSATNKVSIAGNASNTIVGYWDHPENYELVYDASAGS